MIEPQPDSAQQPPAQNTEAAEKATEKATTDILLGRAPESLPGFDLFPYTLASAALLQDAKSTLVLGIAPNQTENLELEIAKYLAIHSVDLMDDEKLAQLSADVLNLDKLRMRCLQQARFVEGNIGPLLNHILAVIKWNGETQIRVVQRTKKPASIRDLMDIHTATLPKP